MKQEEVPQENNKTLAGNKKAVYATGNDGKYSTIASDGWEVEEIVTSQAVEEFERLASDALVKAQSTEISILQYHMFKNRMDLALLSQSTGFFQWTIKRDFKVNKFNTMSEKRAFTYAEVMGISIDELKSVPSN
ncbi:MAG TPA: hypothetical protein EYG94_05365 [Campylobacterales bacterium]|nr:hypothetical protein [Campylobacterales bacterium]